jgi:molybdopterin converting factor subunit 1
MTAAGRTVSVNVHFFGPARDWARRDSVAVELPAGGCVGDVVEALAASSAPLAQRLASVRFAVNAEFAELDRRLQAGDEVAVIPPVSGG